jgi:hypothetical protein
MVQLSAPRKRSWRRSDKIPKSRAFLQFTWVLTARNSGCAFDQRSFTSLLMVAVFTAALIAAFMDGPMIPVFMDLGRTNVLAIPATAAAMLYRKFTGIFDCGPIRIFLITRGSRGICDVQRCQSASRHLRKVYLFDASPPRSPTAEFVLDAKEQGVDKLDVSDH